MKEQIEKQAIEEMAKVIEITEQIARDAHCGLPSPTMYAKELYWHGYRKQNEGEWEFVEEEDFIYKLCKCSSCSKEIFFDADERMYNYCPNCGAKMKGGEE